MSHSCQTSLATKALLTLAVLLFLGLAARGQNELPYRNAKLPVEQRIADLLSRMTLEEKVAQLEGTWQNRDFIKDPNRMLVSVDVTNTGSVRGDEVVQLYIHQEVSSVTRPVKELRGFRRITLGPGETKTVDLPLGPQYLSYLNREMRRVVEPGPFKIMVGGNSDELIETTLSVVAK